MNIKHVVTVKHFFHEYERFSAADKYLLSAEVDGEVFAFFTKHIPLAWLSYDFASSKNTPKNQPWKTQQLKICVPMKVMREKITNGEAFSIGMSKDEMWEKFHGTTKAGHPDPSRGVAFENWAAYHFCGIENRKKDSIGFYVQGDLNIDGQEVQAKFGRAMMCSLNTIHRLQAEVRRH